MDNMDDYEALVIVQAAGFTEGEVILTWSPCSSSQEWYRSIFAEVLSHFVTMANERLKGVRLATNLC